MRLKVDDTGFDPVLLRMSEAARLLGVGRSTIYALAASGTIPYLRVGRALRIPRRAIEQWVEGRTVAPGMPGK